MFHIRKTSPSDLVVVVTGASAGICRAVAVAFAKQGCRLALISRDEQALESTSKDVEAAGGQGLAIVADVADAQAVFNAAERIVAHWGRIDVWVNGAMATIFGRLETITPEEFKRVTEVTYLGQVHGTMAALKYMRPRRRGTIVQLGSSLSYRAIPLQTAYCGAKFAVRGFTDALRAELIHERSPVRVTMVQLPAVNTPQFDWARSRLPRRLQPVPPIYQPEAVAEAIARAAEFSPRELWIGWPSIRAIIGNFLLPGLLDRLAARQAWDGQMTDEPAAPGRADNLFTPVAGDPGAHGRFDARSRGHVMSLNSACARGAVAMAALGTFLSAVFLVRVGDKNRRAEH
jgi:NAD(P)-dependent dehydrogenase (short-subunit alcohol dehydrogenase family)